MALFGLFGEKAAPRPRLQRITWPVAVYAIGDVHGCADLLHDLEALILADAATLGDGPRWIVMLGDYVDRGPDSASVLEHVSAPAPAGFERILLCGNHEELMLDFLAAPAPDHHWLRLGGDITLLSYGIDVNALFAGNASRPEIQQALQSHIPARYIALLQSLAACVALPGTVFVHAGLRPGIPLDRQSERDMLWMRPDALAHHPAGIDDPLVVHGHTPAAQPVVEARRICVDTGAFFTGILTAARLDRHGLQKLIAAGRP